MKIRFNHRKYDSSQGHTRELKKRKLNKIYLKIINVLHRLTFRGFKKIDFHNRLPFKSILKIYLKKVDFYRK
jgi:hypothetical protein